MNFWQGRKVLVTGGAGFIGSNLVERLVREGARVRVADNLERGRLENITTYADAIEFLETDLRNPQACLNACQDIEIVFHLAAKVGGLFFFSHCAGEVLINNTLIDTCMLRAALTSGVERYLYASSTHVYPAEREKEPDSPPIREEEAIPANPPVSYGWAKLLGEQAVKLGVAEQKTMRGVVVRLIGVYGKNLDVDLEKGSIIPVLIRRAIEYPERKPFIVRSSGEEGRSYCYIDDVLDAMLLTVQKLDEHQFIGPLNTGNEGQVSIREVAETIVEISGKSIPIVFQPSGPTVIWSQTVDCSQARAILDGWRPRVSLREGLQLVYSAVEKRLKTEKIIR